MGWPGVCARVAPEQCSFRRVFFLALLSARQALADSLAGRLSRSYRTDSKGSRATSHHLYMATAAERQRRQCEEQAEKSGRPAPSRSSCASPAGLGCPKSKGQTPAVTHTQPTNTNDTGRYVSVSQQLSSCLASLSLRAVGFQVHVLMRDLVDQASCELLPNASSRRRSRRHRLLCGARMLDRVSSRFGRRGAAAALPIPPAIATSKSQPNQQESNVR